MPNESRDDQLCCLLAPPRQRGAVCADGARATRGTSLFLWSAGSQCLAVPRRSNRSALRRSSPRTAPEADSDRPRANRHGKAPVQHDHHARRKDHRANQLRRPHRRRLARAVRAAGPLSSRAAWARVALGPDCELLPLGPPGAPLQWSRSTVSRAAREWRVCSACCAGRAIREYCPRRAGVVEDFRGGRGRAGRWVRADGNGGQLRRCAAVYAGSTSGVCVHRRHHGCAALSIRRHVRRLFVRGRRREWLCR